MVFEIDQSLRYDFGDYYVKCIQLANTQGIKMTRVVDVLNLYDGDYIQPDD